MKHVFAILILFLSIQVHADTITFRSDFWCPYVCNANSSRPGYMVEIVRQVFEKQGHKVEFKLDNWVRAIKETRSNQAQALLGCSQVDAPDFIFPQKSLGIIRNAYFTTKHSSWFYQGRHSLQNKRIGVINGYAYGDSIDTLIQNRHKTFVPFSGERPLNQMIKAIQNGRIDGFIENPVTLQFSLAEMNLPADTLKAVGWVDTHDPFLFAGFSPNNPRSKLYAEMLSKGIDDLRRSGELRRILEKYKMADWDQPATISLGALNNLSPRLFKGSLDLVNVINTGSF
ncbi:substrate-binding periplasmic protein [Bdellovibrio bacteriovorus]|uniref:substrate-binding periplasmic protein n=1 Tax=Bdellovibrio TaxID=958 RepID=UPI0035A871E8